MSRPSHQTVFVSLLWATFVKIVPLFVVARALGFDFSFVTCNFNSTEVALVDYLHEGKSHFVGVTAHYSNGEVSDMAKLQVVVGG